MDDNPHVHPIRRAGAPITIRLGGRIVATAMPDLAGLRLMVEEHAGSCFILDFEEVEFIDSTGIDFLLALRAVLQEHGGSLRLLAIPHRVHHAMEMSGAVRALLSPPPSTRLLVA